MLAAYLARLGLSATPRANLRGLDALLAAHRQAIPFENLDIPLGRGIAIDAESVFAKLVTQRRGGYCFEQNGLFGAMLTRLGIVNRPLLARVRLAQPPGVTPPRTHVLLLAELGRDGPCIVDAGFGGAFVPSLPLVDGAAAQTPDGARHRLRRCDGQDPLGGTWLLERTGPAAATDGRAAEHDGWQAQYTFDLASVAPADLEQANHWTSTRPGTRFTTLRVASRVLPDGFAALTDQRLTIYRAGTALARTIGDQADYAHVLREQFGLNLPSAALARIWAGLDAGADAGSGAGAAFSAP